MRKYDALFLDAQGTILRAHPSVPALYAGVCRRFGKRARYSEIAAAMQELSPGFRRRPGGRDSRYDTSDPATREWWAGYNAALFRRLEMQEGLDQFLDTLWDLFGQPESWRLFPEVKEVLAEVRRRGYRIGVVSNWDSRLVPICGSLGLSPLVDFVLASAPAGMEKPDRRIFETALSRAGVPPERAIHVGDDFDADVLGARGAGLDALLIHRDESTPAGEAIRSLRELLQILV